MNTHTAPHAVLPAGTPPAVIDRLNAEMVKILLEAGAK